MKKNKNIVILLLFEYAFCIIMFIAIFIFLIWIKFSLIIATFFGIIALSFYFEYIIKFINLIFDIKNQRIITEKLYVNTIIEEKNDFKYKQIEFNKVKNGKFIGEKITLIADNKIDIKENTFVEISYYIKSKVILNINN